MPPEHGDHHQNIEPLHDLHMLFSTRCAVAIHVSPRVDDKTAEDPGVHDEVDDAHGGGRARQRACRVRESGSHFSQQRYP